MRRCLVGFLLLIGLSGCATIADHHLLPIPVSVRVIHSDRTASGEQGHYVYASPEDGLEVSDTADLVTTVDWNIGLIYRTFKTIEWMAKDAAFRNEADIVVIRPRDTHSRVIWHLRAEVWRTRGYQQQIEDDIPKPGTTLLPPPGFTYTIRVHNIKECASEAATFYSQPLPVNEASLIAGRDTTLFANWDNYARRDYFWRPTQLGWENTWARVPDGASDRYVVCLMKRGYQWPQPPASND